MFQSPQIGELRWRWARYLTAERARAAPLPARGLPVAVTRLLTRHAMCCKTLDEKTLDKKTLDKTLPAHSLEGIASCGPDRTLVAAPVNSWLSPCC